MTTLARLQLAFAAALRGGSAGLEAVTALIAPSPGDLTGGITAAQRVQIYRNHHRLSLAAALATHYPAIRGLIGAEAFEQLAQDYVDLYPPDDACLARYGTGFPDFLAQDRRLLDLPYLADAARFDWALITAETAGSVRPFLADDLAAAGSDLAEMRFSPHPAATFIHSRYPLPAIRRLAMTGEMEGAFVDLASGGCDLLIFRQERAARTAVLEPAAAAFVTALIAGMPLGQAAATVDQADLPALIANYLVSGAFCLEA